MVARVGFSLRVERSMSWFLNDSSYRVLFMDQQVATGLDELRGYSFSI